MKVYKLTPIICMGCWPNKQKKIEVNPTPIKQPPDLRVTSILVSTQYESKVLHKAELNLMSKMIMDTFDDLCELNSFTAFKVLKEDYTRSIWKKIEYPYVQIQQLYGICKWNSPESTTLSGPGLICSTETKNQFVVGGQFEKGRIVNSKKYFKIFSTGAYYVGQIDKSLTPDGEGQLHVNKNVEYYKGSFLKGVPHGKGQKISPDRTFKGDFRKGEIIKGKQITTRGEYEGQFHNNQKHGKGILRMNSGLLFDGQFENGKKTGSGVLKNANGQVISSGMWKNDKKLE